MSSKSSPQQLPLIFPDTPLHFRAVGLASLVRSCRVAAKHPAEKANRKQWLLDAYRLESEIRAIADQALQPFAS